MHLIKICAEEKISGGEFLPHPSSIILVNTKHLVFASIIYCDTAEQNCHRIFAPYLQKYSLLWQKGWKKFSHGRDF